MGRGLKPFQKHLVAYWPFDTDFNDKISPYCHLVPSLTTPTITLNTGVFENAAYGPPGSTAILRDDTSSIPDIDKIAFTDGINDVPYFISLHCYITSAGSASPFGTIFGKNSLNSSAAPGSEYQLRVNAAVNQISFIKYSEGLGSNSVLYTFTAPPINTWFWLLITDDGSGNVKIYINNSEQFTIVSTTGTGFVKFMATSLARVGCFNALGVPSATRYFEGGIDDLGVGKNYIPTQEERDWIWNGGNPRRLKNV